MCLLFRGKINIENDAVLITREGSEIHIADSCAPVHISGGKVSGTVLVFRDVSEAYRRKQDERFELSFQRTVAEISSKFLKVTEDDFGRCVDYALRRLGELFDVDRCYYFRFSGNLKTMTNTHEWCSPGTVPQKDRIRDFPVENMPWWRDSILKLKPVHIPDVNKLPVEAEAERKEFKSQGIKSLLCIPTRDSRGSPTGFIGFDAVRSRRMWNEGHIYMLGVLGERISGAASRTEAERALKNSQGELKEAQQMAKMGRWDLFHGENRLAWTGSIFEIFEVKPEGFEATYEAFLSFVHPNDREMVNDAWEKSLSEKKPYDIEHRLLLKGGRVKWVVESCRTEFDLRGEPVHSVGIVQDITRRKKSEEKLKVSEERFSVLAKQSRTMVWEVDKNGLYTYVSGVSMDIIGYRPDELVGKKHFYDICPEEDRKKTKSFVLETMRKGEPLWDWENRIVHKDGGIVWMLSSGMTLLDSSGKAGGYRGSDKDITERKKAEGKIEYLSFHDS